VTPRDRKAEHRPLTTQGREPILYCAPGAGLGHLTRACAITTRLAERAVSARIVTHSLFAAGMARVTGCAIDHIPRERWQSDLGDYVSSHRASLVVLDAFPRGLSGEWADWRPSTARLVYLARRLNLDAYANAAGADWDTPLPGMAHVIVAEPLGDDHDALLAQWETDVARLPGRIRLPETIPAPPVPAGLADRLESGCLDLVVHSGPDHEIRTLIQCAQETSDDANLAVISPRPIETSDVDWFEYFPAARLFADAHRVISGAGYNVMAEMAQHPEKHLAVPFPRTFDDQHARLAGPPAGQTDGGAVAADHLAAWLLEQG